MRAPRAAVVALAVAATAASLSLSGCAQVTSQRVIASQERARAADTAGMKELRPADAMKLAKVLTGEVHTVYPADNGLARVYGQVANLGEKPYQKVKFNIVATVGGKAQGNQTTKIVGTIVLDEGLKPGDIKPFDVQTAATMGDVKNLVVVVGGLQ